MNLQKRQICVARSEWKGHVSAEGRTAAVRPLTRRLAGALRDAGICAVPSGLRAEGRAADAEGRPGLMRRAAREPTSEPGVHVLRHTFGSHLAMRGAPARAIQELAGHQDLATTKRNMRLSPAAHRGGDSATRIGTGSSHRVEEWWRRREFGRDFDDFARKMWRRRESNPRPKGLSLQESTCVVRPCCFAAAVKARRKRRPLAR